jgi:hypothetical protein
MPVKTLLLELKTPAAFSHAPALSNEAISLGWIPGSTVRGMLAAAYLSETPHPDQRFADFFAETGLAFGPLWLQDTAPLPRSAYTCKRCSGFKADSQGADDERHGVVNRLWPHQQTEQCQCGQPLQRHEPESYAPYAGPRSAQPQLETHMRTAVSPRQSAREGMLYTQQELAAGQVFAGTVSGSKEGLKQLEEWLGETKTVWGGRRRHGQATVHLTSAESETPHFFPATTPGQAWLTMTLRSELILVDEQLRPVTQLDAAALQRWARFPTEVSITVPSRFVAQHRVAGWSGVGQMFKPDDWAFASGSTWLLEFPAAQQAGVQQWAEAVWEVGLGLRRAEGFGRVTFADKLHNQTFTNPAEAL